MLIKGLCDYYDILADAGKVLPDGYSSVKIHYLVALSQDGRIDEIINYQDKIEIAGKNGSKKIKYEPRNEIMPKRTEKSAIDFNIIEHRPLYIFGLNYTDYGLSAEDKTDKAKKSHEVFVDANLKFIEGLNSEVINAFRNFLCRWKPEDETENNLLLGIKKNYGKSGYAFCLTGHPDRLLHNDPAIKGKWEELYSKKDEMAEEKNISQCAISGEKAKIARIHTKIKGVVGGQPSGTVLVGFNNPSENSYGNEQSYNSNISEKAMNKYTEALNYLLASPEHKVLLDEMTIVFWAMDRNETYGDLLMSMLYGTSELMNAGQSQQMLKQLLNDAGKGKISERRLETLDLINPDVDFYMAAIKPNNSRVSVKFVYRRKFCEILWNVAGFQHDLQMEEELHVISLNRVKMELISPKSKNDNINSSLAARLLESILQGGKYPMQLLDAAIRRARTDDNKPNDVTAGIIKACLSRNFKENIKMGLDKENTDQAYLCGRLFAVLEKLQRDASNNSLNRTIKDAYFSSASVKPALIFPKLMTLAQHHLDKLKSPVYFNKLIGEIIDKFANEFPESLDLKEQGKFIIGYYQQYQSFFRKNDENKKAEEEV